MRNDKFKKQRSSKKEPSSVLRVLYMYSQFKWRIIGLIAIGCIGIVLFALMPMFTRNVFNLLEDSILAGTDPQIRTVYMYLALFGILALFNEVFQLFATFMILRYEDVLCKKVMNGFKAKLDLVPMSFLEKYQPGDLAKRVGGLVHGSVRLLLPVTFRASRSIFFFVTTAIVMFMINWILAIVVIMSLPLCIIVARLVSKRTQKYFNNFAKNMLITSAHVDQKFSLQEFYTTHGIEHDPKKFEEINKKQTKAMVGEGVAVAFNGLYINFIQNFMMLVVTLLFCIMFVTGHITDFGILPAFIMFSNRFLANAVVVTTATNLLQGIAARSPAVFEILDYPEDVTEREHIDIKRVNNSIVFKNVTLRNKEEKLVDNVSFEIKQGGSVAFVGQAGSGKTFLVDLLAKLAIPSEGKILVDGIDLADITSKSYYKCVGVSLEKPFIFRGSVAENLLYGIRRELPENVMAVTEKLGSHDFIDALENGYETIISGGSELLGMGQKQAVCVARLVLQNPDVAVFHQSLAAADAVTEKSVYEKIMKHKKSQTTVFVTHRLPSVEKCDIIYYMERGRIVEKGTHRELMMKKKKYYNAYMGD